MESIEQNRISREIMPLMANGEADYGNKFITMAIINIMVAYDSTAIPTNRSVIDGNDVDEVHVDLKAQRGVMIHIIHLHTYR